MKKSDLKRPNQHNFAHYTHPALHNFIGTLSSSTTWYSIHAPKWIQSQVLTFWNKMIVKYIMYLNLFWLCLDFDCNPQIQGCIESTDCGTLPYDHLVISTNFFVPQMKLKSSHALSFAPCYYDLIYTARRWSH